MQSSPFGRLPAELRDHIYELALQWPYPIYVGTNFFEVFHPCVGTPEDAVIRHGYFAAGSDTSKINNKSLTALTRTCKLIRHESSPVFFSINAFHFTTHKDEDDTSSTSSGNGNGLPTFTHFLAAIGSHNVAALRKCTIEIPGIDFPMQLNSPYRMFEELLADFRALQALGATVLTKCDVTVVVSFLYYHSKKPLALGVGCRDLCASLSAVIDDYHAQWQSFQKRPRHHRELAIAVDNLRNLRDQLEQSTMSTVRQ